MINKEVVAVFFDRKSFKYEDSRYAFMREIRATAIRKQIIGNDILDIGCNCGHVIKEYIDDQNVTGVDISPVCIKYAQKHVSGVNFIVGSAEDLPVKDSS